MILREIVEAVNQIPANQREQLKNDLNQIRQALQLGHIDAAYQIINEMELTLDQME